MTQPSSSCSFGNAFVSQRPVFTKKGRRKAWCNTVKSGKVIHADKRPKQKFL
jgi:hypothetical protein